MKPNRLLRDQSGFILPGVVMFVIVLTIIGLSLFSLSSYEAQFFLTTSNNSSLFYDASGGIDRGRFLIAATNNLGSVANSLPGTGNITAASARQGASTTGPIQWGSADPVIINVEATKNGKKRTLEASFIPVMNPYDNLASCSSTQRGFYNSTQINTSQRHVALTGRIWQTYSQTSPPAEKYDWLDDILPSLGSSVQISLGLVPTPQVSTFYNAHQAGLSEPTLIHGVGNNHYSLDASASPGRIKFFKSTKISDEDWSFLNTDQGNSIDLDVDGVAIWMFQTAFFSAKPVVVQGTSDDMLVLIANKTYDSDENLASFHGVDDVGFIFKGGLHSPDVPVIIVSDGYVVIDREGAPPAQTINWLSIYANFGWVRGPDTGSYTYSHVESAQPFAEQNLQTLLDNGFLPNANPKRRQLTFIPGTWQDLGTN